jgi:hypothetical protein
MIFKTIAHFFPENQKTLSKRVSLPRRATASSAARRAQISPDIAAGIGIVEREFLHR